MAQTVTPAVDDGQSPTGSGDEGHEARAPSGRPRRALTTVLLAVLDLSARRVFDISATQRSLSLFRMALYGTVAFETFGLLRIRDYAITSEYGRGVLLPLCFVASLVAISGLFTRAASIVVLVSFKMLQPDLFAWYEVDWVIEFFGLLFCFAPASTAWSLDARRRRVSDNQLVSPVFVGAVVVVMTIVYFDSILTKLDSVIWTDGIAVWLSAFVPHVSAWRLPAWLQKKPLLELFTYVTIAYEMLFPLILVRPLRRVMVALGLALHLGIALLLPLRGFGLIMMAPLLLFVPTGAGQPAPSHVDSSEDGIGTLLRAAWSRRLLPAVTVCYCLLVAASFVHMKSHGTRTGLTQAMGVHPTGVYADGKFTMEPPILRLEITTSDGMRGLPSFDEEGYPQVRDRLWKVYGFFLRFRPEPVENLTRYVEMFKDRCDLERCRVDVYAKDVRLPLVYDENIIPELRDRPWRQTGSLIWDADDDALRWDPEPGVPTDRPW